MACQAGVAPFEYKSGTTVRARPGVRQHARKPLKSLFHLAARASIGAKAELQDYDQRKVKEGNPVLADSTTGALLTMTSAK